MAAPGGYDTMKDRRIGIPEALRQAVVVVEGLLIGLFLLFLTMNLLDLTHAWHAQSCSVDRSSSCYPWGTEGPVAGLWAYASKTNYLVLSVFDSMVSCAAFVSALVLPQGKRIFALLVGVALICLSGFFLPLII